MPKPRKAKAAPRTKKVVPHLASIAVVVSDCAKAVAWYTEKFGLRRVDDDDHWQTVGESPGGAVLHLCQMSEFDKTAELEPGNSGIHFRLPGDFRTACAELKRRGVEFSTPPEKFEWGWGAVARDPDGNEIYLSPQP